MQSLAPSNYTRFELPPSGGALSGYGEAVTTFPLIFCVIGMSEPSALSNLVPLTCAGIMSVLILQLCLLLRCCLPWFKCAAVQERDNQSLADFRLVVARKRRALVCFDGVFGLLALASAHLVYLAATYFSSARGGLQGALRFLEALAADLALANRGLGAANEQTDAFFAATQTAPSTAHACSDAVQVLRTDSVAAVNASSLALAALLDSAQSSLATLDDFVLSNAEQFQTYFVYGYYGVSCAVVLVFALGVACQLRRLVQCNIVLSELYVALLTLLVAGLLLVMVKPPPLPLMIIAP